MALTTCEQDCVNHKMPAEVCLGAVEACDDLASCQILMRCNAEMKGTGGCADAIYCENDAKDAAAGCKCVLNMRPTSMKKYLAFHVCTKNVKDIRNAPSECRQIYDRCSGDR